MAHHVGDLIGHLCLKVCHIVDLVYSRCLHGGGYLLGVGYLQGDKVLHVCIQDALGLENFVKLKVFVTLRAFL